MDPISLYFHIPFCVHRCAYCDFNTYAGQLDQLQGYVDALCREVEVVGQHISEKVEAKTIFFGGGTPSLLSPVQFEKILRTVDRSFSIKNNAEISIEANPGTCSHEDLVILCSIGINRISFGVQSANPEELRMLERIHNYPDVINSFYWARQAGIDNINLDLIYGLPEQSLEQWQKTLRSILELEPDHLSLYSLTLEHGTPFGRWADRGLMPIPDPDEAARMYEWSREQLASSGFVHYEISNWALQDLECKHNLQYWRNFPYLGFGAGAHGYAGGYRYSNALRIKTYINRIEDWEDSVLPFPLSPATVNYHKNSVLDDMQETMITGLRLTREGISAALFFDRFSVDVLEVFGKEINDLVEMNLLEWITESKDLDGPVKRLRLTEKGQLLGNQVFLRFVGNGS